VDRNVSISGILRVLNFGQIFAFLEILLKRSTRKSLKAHFNIEKSGTGQSDIKNLSPGCYFKILVKIFKIWGQIS
jgi:hypothetical protein